MDLKSRKKIEAPDRIWAFAAPEIAEDEGGATIVAHEDFQRGAVEYVLADLHDATEAQLAKAVAALREIERNYANPDMTHLDYRVDAMQSAFTVLAEIEKGEPK